METDKVTITISGLHERELTVASPTRVNGMPHQVDLFQGAGSSIRASSPAPIEPPEVPLKTPPEAAKPAGKPKAPWELATEPGKGLNFQPDTLLHAKMNWVCDNVPKMSRLRILRDGAMAECDRLIAIHHKD